MNHQSLTKVTARARGWHKDNKDFKGKVQENDEDMWAEILTQDFFKVHYPDDDIVFLITVKLILWLQNATCERGFSLRTLIKTRNRTSMGDTLLDILTMLSSTVMMDLTPGCGMDTCSKL